MSRKVGTSILPKFESVEFFTISFSENPLGISGKSLKFSVTVTETIDCQWGFTVLNREKKITDLSLESTDFYHTGTLPVFT